MQKQTSVNNKINYRGRKFEIKIGENITAALSGFYSAGLLNEKGSQFLFLPHMGFFLQRLGNIGRCLFFRLIWLRSCLFSIPPFGEL